MNAIVPFQFGGKPVRVIDRDGQPWFSLNDVCAVLEIANARDAAGRLDDDEKGVVTTDTLGGRQEATVIDESGLYKLALRSRKAAAKRFTKWVTREVLPSIRTTGTYGAPAPSLDLRDPAVLHRLLLDHAGRGMAADQRIAELEPQAAALVLLTQAHGSLAVTHAAKAMGVRPGRLFDWLEANGWLYRGNDGLLSYQAKIDQGLIEHKVHRLDRGPLKQAKLVNHALLTPKGIARLTALRAGA